MADRIDLLNASTHGEMQDWTNENFITLFAHLLSVVTSQDVVNLIQVHNISGTSHNDIRHEIFEAIEQITPKIQSHDSDTLAHSYIRNAIITLMRLVDVQYDDETGDITFFRADGTTETINIFFEEFFKDFDFDPETNELIFIKADETEVRVDMSALVTELLFATNPQIIAADTDNTIVSPKTLFYAIGNLAIGMLGSFTDVAINATDSIKNALEKLQGQLNQTVKLSGSQSIDGEKTFSTIPIVGTAEKGTNDDKSASTKFVQTALADVGGIIFDYDNWTSNPNVTNAITGIGASTTTEKMTRDTIEIARRTWVKSGNNWVCTEILRTESGLVSADRTRVINFNYVSASAWDIVVGD